MGELPEDIVGDETARTVRHQQQLIAPVQHPA